MVSSTDFIANLKEAAVTFDKAQASELVEALVKDVHSSGEVYPEQEAQEILNILLDNRYFDLAQQAGDVFIQWGEESPKVKRQYAQALIDQGNITAAIYVLEKLEQDSPEEEKDEARGLIGRAYKQLYINARKNVKGLPSSLDIKHLNEAMLCYYNAYQNSNYAWQGINTVALVKRAERDGVSLTNAPNTEALAKDILSAINEKKSKGEIESWDYAIAVEAYLALSKPEEALGWLSHYVKSDDVNAFGLASTLRQFREVWQLEHTKEPGDSLLPLLMASLLEKEGGYFELTPTPKSWEVLTNIENKGYEKVFGHDEFETLKWFTLGINRARTVGRVENISGRFVGTGFLVRGSDLNESFGEELLFLTNAHVLSPKGIENGSLSPRAAVFRFEVLGQAPEYKVAEVLWSSPSHQLDATLVRIEPKISLDKLSPNPIASNLPPVDNKQHVLVIGHPQGRNMSFSLRDNLLLDHKVPKVHYRAPTEPGSSGSPVFNSDWELIALHHSGSKSMPRLNDQAGTYEANEGIWIQSIINALKDDL